MVWRVWCEECGVRSGECRECGVGSVVCGVGSVVWEV
jgi:hypothetical protein